MTAWLDNLIVMVTVMETGIHVLSKKKFKDTDYD
jgi:hypothetical protein